MTHPGPSGMDALASQPRGRAQAGATDTVFVARGVSKVYGQGDATVHALRGIDFDIARGEFIVLLGASGSGKSTLLNILGGLDVPTRGEVRVEIAGLADPIIGPLIGLDPLAPPRMNRVSLRAGSCRARGCRRWSTASAARWWSPASRCRPSTSLPA